MVGIINEVFFLSYLFPLCLWVCPPPLMESSGLKHPIRVRSWLCDASAHCVTGGWAWLLSPEHFLSWIERSLHQDLERGGRVCPAAIVHSTPDSIQSTKAVVVHVVACGCWERGSLSLSTALSLVPSSLGCRLREPVGLRDGYLPL